MKKNVTFFVFGEPNGRLKRLIHINALKGEKISVKRKGVKKIICTKKLIITLRS